MWRKQTGGCRRRRRRTTGSKVVEGGNRVSEHVRSYVRFRTRWSVMCRRLMPELDKTTAGDGPSEIEPRITKFTSVGRLIKSKIQSK